MKSFQYRAVSYDGELKEGAISAPTESAAISKIQESGFIPLSLKMIDDSVANSNSKNKFSFSLSLGKKDKVIGFTRSMATLLNAGLPLDYALKMQAQLEDNRQLKNIILDAHEKLREGEDFATILQRSPQYFSNLYVGLVRAGEITGKLNVNMDKLANYLEEAKRTRDALVSALIYPVLLAIVTVVSVIILMVSVIPKFKKMFADMGGAIPDSTRFIFEVSDLMRDQGAMIASVVLVMFAVTKLTLLNHRVKRARDSWILRLPLLGLLSAKFDVSRFSHALGLMTANGIPLLNALERAQTVLVNSTLKDDVALVRTSLAQGGKMSEVLGERGNFPGLAVHMIRVGEESGKLDEMMQRIAEICESDAKVALQRLVGLMEPVLIIGLGIIVAGIIVSILSAVLSINDLVF